MISAPSPNFDNRVSPPDMIVLHYTGMKTGAEALARMTDPEAKVSAHYMIEEDGRVYSLVSEERRAWHAGVSFWKGATDINAASIGIELVNPGHEFGYRAFPDAQIDALIELMDDIRSRWTVPESRILGHSDVAPARKTDPGELFPWKRLAEAGHGVWVEPNGAPGAPLAEGDEGAGVFAMQAGLTRIGYDCAPSGKFDAQTTTVVRAFQRHWLQTRVDGIADGETRARLVAVLRA
jgi:N-acetylmuramoyl-L-alanine amidase